MKTQNQPKGEAVPTCSVDRNPVCTVWAAMDDGDGGIAMDESRPLWRGPLSELASRTGAPYRLLHSNKSGGWTAQPANGHRSPLNGYRL